MPTGCTITMPGKRLLQPEPTENDAVMDEQGSPKGIVTPVVRGIRLLRYIAEGGNTANLSEVGRSIDVNRVTVMRLLATLEHEGLIERLPQGGHRAGMGMLTMSAAALGSIEPLEAGRRAVERLSQELGVSAYLVVLDGFNVVYVHRHMPEGGLVSHIRVGSRVPAFLTAPGRALLAQLADQDITRLWNAWQAESAARPDTGLPDSALLQDVTDFLRQTERDRAEGHVWSFSGYEAGINACAAAIKGSGGRPVGALSVVAPQPLFDADSGLQGRMQEQVVQATRELSRLSGG